MPRKTKSAMEPTKTESNPPSLSSDVTPEQRRMIIRMLLSGEFPTDAMIARAAKVRTGVVTAMLESDPELKKMREEAEHEMAQIIERSAVNLATNGRNEIAKQKSQEFLLKKMMPGKYGDDAGKNTGNDTLKRIILVKELPVVSVDKNGIPIAESKNPFE